MAKINGTNAQILAASGTSTTFSNEAMTDAGTHQTYTITNAAHRYWDDGTAVVIQESTDAGATWHTAPTPDSVQYVGGIIKYTVARNSAYLYRAQSGKYFTITTIGGGHEWDLTITSDLLDVSEFGTPWHQFIDALNGGTGTLARYWIDQYFWTLISSGVARLILALYTTTVTGQRYEGYAFIKQIGTKSPVNGVVEESLGFTLDKSLYYNPGP